MVNTALTNFMSDFDLIIRGGSVVLPGGERLLDVGVKDGRIAALEPAVFGSTAADLDATGFHLLPGIVDAGVRLGGDGGPESIREGTAALAAGGVGTCLELTEGPGVRDRASFEARRAAGEAHSRVDFALWGALTADNLGELESLAECGVIGFHADMAGPGAIDDGALLEGMCRASELKQIVSVRAESGAITAHFARAAAAAGRVGMRDYFDSHPVIAELEAVQRAILLAWEADCAVHFPQVSTGRAVELIAGAKAQGLNVSCSTSPHYLLLSEEDAERLGDAARCVPPLRGRAEVDALWARLAAGEIDFLVSGDGPAGAGIAGGQSAWGLLLGEALGEERPIPLARLADLLATSAARRFRIHPRKGELAIGADADLAILNLRAEETGGTDLYAGRKRSGRVLRTLRRGKSVYNGGGSVGEVGGEFVQAGES